MRCSRRCQPFNSDTKLRARVVLVEVLSAATRRLDEGEKAIAFMSFRSNCRWLLSMKA